MLDFSISQEVISPNLFSQFLQYSVANRPLDSLKNVAKLRAVSTAVSLPPPSPLSPKKISTASSLEARTLRPDIGYSRVFNRLWRLNSLAMGMKPRLQLAMTFWQLIGENGLATHGHHGIKEMTTYLYNT